MALERVRSTGLNGRLFGEHCLELFAEKMVHVVRQRTGCWRRVIPLVVESSLMGVLVYVPIGFAVRRKPLAEPIR